MSLKKLAHGAFLAILTAFVLLAGSLGASAQGWSWDGKLSGGWSVSQPSSGSPGWYGSAPGWGWSSSPGTGSGGGWSSSPGAGTGGGWWWTPSVPSPGYPGGGTPAPEPGPGPAPAPELPPAGGGSAAEEQYLVNAANAERAAAGR